MLNYLIPRDSDVPLAASGVRDLARAQFALTAITRWRGVPA